MIKSNFAKLVFILLFITNCGYSPIYTNVDNINFRINIMEMNGVREVNNLIKSNFDSYSLKDSKKYYNIIVNSKYSKNIVAKDTTGAATEYKIILETNFKVNNENYSNEFKFKESINMQSMSNRLEEKNYEENLRSSLVNIITQKLILQLSRVR